MARLRKCEGYTGCWKCLNKADYALMSQFEWICFNKAEDDIGRIWHFHKHFVKTQEKEDPQGNILDFPFLPSGVPVSVAEYVWISLNICLNIL